MAAAGSATDHLANERTFLAYVRTSLAFIGFGFVIARFSVYMREFAQLQHQNTALTHGVSDTFGVIMVFIGVLVALFGAYRYARQAHAIREGKADPLSARAAIATAVAIAVFGGILAIVLHRV